MFESLSKNDIEVITQIILSIVLICIFEYAYKQDQNWYWKKVDKIIIFLNKATMASAVINYARPRIPTTPPETISHELSIIYLVATIFIFVWFYYYLRVALTIMLMALRYKYLKDEEFRFYINKIESEEKRKIVKEALGVSEEKDNDAT